MSDEFIPDFGSIGQAAPNWSAKRPLRIAILGDFSAGAARGRLETGDQLARRKPMPVEFDTLEQAMQRLQLSVTLPLGADGVPVSIEFASTDDFHPDELYANVPLFSELATLRKRLNNASQFAAAAPAVLAWADGAGPSVSRLARKAAARGVAPSSGSTLDDFARLTGRASAAAESEGAVSSLMKRVVGPFVKPSASPQKDQLVAAVDAGLSDAMSALLQHADFRSVEALWRGVDFLLRRVETSHQLQVHLLDISAEEFAADLSKVSDLADSGLYKLLVEQPSQDANGGYAYIAGCYEFDATPPHAELLGRAANVASHAGAALLTGMQTDAFSNRREPPHRLVRSAFAALREHPAASFLGLFGPHFLLRHPYGKKSDPISSFSFEEFSRQVGLRGMLWGHPALLALSVLAQPGATMAVNDLPFHHYVDEHGDSVALPCTDRLITTNIATLLREAGINGVMAHKGEAMVRFSGLEAVNGDGLAAAGAAPRKARSEARMSLQARIDTTASAPAAGSASGVRRAGAVAAAVQPVVEEEPEEVAASLDDADTSSADVSTEPAQDDAAQEPASEAAPQDELAALLASLEAPADEAQAAEPEPDIDSELDSLLKSLG